VLQLTREPKAYLLFMVFFLSSVIGGVLENTDVFVSQEDLTLCTGGPRFGIWIGISEFVSGFDIDMCTLWNGAEEGVRGGAETEDGMP